MALLVMPFTTQVMIFFSLAECFLFTLFFLLRRQCTAVGLF